MFEKIIKLNEITERLQQSKEDDLPLGFRIEFFEECISRRMLALFFSPRIFDHFFSNLI